MRNSRGERKRCAQEYGSCCWRYVHGNLCRRRIDCASAHAAAAGTQSGCCAACDGQQEARGDWRRSVKGESFCSYTREVAHVFVDSRPRTSEIEVGTRSRWAVQFCPTGGLSYRNRRVSRLSGVMKGKENLPV